MCVCVCYSEGTTAPTSASEVAEQEAEYTKINQRYLKSIEMSGKQTLTLCIYNYIYCTPMHYITDNQPILKLWGSLNNGHCYSKTKAVILDVQHNVMLVHALFHVRYKNLPNDRRCTPSMHAKYDHTLCVSRGVVNAKMRNNSLFVFCMTYSCVQLRPSRQVCCCEVHCDCGPTAAGITISYIRTLVHACDIQMHLLFLEKAH